MLTEIFPFARVLALDKRARHISARVNYATAQLRNYATTQGPNSQFPIPKFPTLKSKISNDLQSEIQNLKFHNRYPRMQGK